MHTLVKLTLSGEVHYFHFNNYALIELTRWAKKVNDLKGGEKQDESDILKSTITLNDLIEQHFLLGIAVIVYCGLIGYKYSKFEIQHSYTMEWVSEQVGNVNLNEWTPIWEAYKDATGMSEFLKKQVELNETRQAESDAKPVKKKTPASKKNLNLPSAKSA